MMKSIKKILDLFFTHSETRPEPAYPAGSIDTSTLRTQLLQLAERMDSCFSGTGKCMHEGTIY